MISKLTNGSIALSLFVVLGGCLAEEAADEQMLRLSADGTEFEVEGIASESAAVTSSGVQPMAAAPAHVLVWQAYYTSAVLAAELQALGHTVTVVTALPTDLSGYDTIWHVGAFTPVTAAERTRLAAFLASGGGLYMTGERPCCEALNASWDLFIADVVSGGTAVTVGNQGDINGTTGTYGGPYVVNQSAAGGIASTPNATNSINLSAPGGMAGLDGDNVLAVGQNNTPVAAVWDSDDLVGGAGCLAMVMDVNWLGNLNTSNRPLINNIQTFLQDCNPGPPCHETVEANEDLQFMSFPRTWVLEDYSLADCGEVDADVCGGDIDAVGNILSISSDEESTASANHDCELEPEVCIDVEIVDNSHFRIRNNRNSYLNGRVYTVEYEVDGSVHSCQFGVRLWSTQVPVADAPAYTVYP